MKKIFAFSVLFAAAATALVSCTKDVATETAPAPELSGLTKTLTLHAGIASTRTELGTDGNQMPKLQWAENDTYGIFYVAANGTDVLGYVESPAYSEGTETYTLEDVPAETAYLYCVYPYDEDLAEEKDVTRIPVSLSMNQEFATTFAGGNLMTAKAEVDDDSVTVIFEPMVTLLEFNIYNTMGNPEVLLNYVTVDVGEDFCAGENVVVDFSGTSAELKNLDSSIGVFQPKSDYNIGKTKEEGVKGYGFVVKGVYQSFTVEVATSLWWNSKWENATYTFAYSNVDFESYYGRTLNIDLANAPLEEGGAAEITEFSPYGESVLEREFEGAFYGTLKTPITFAGNATEFAIWDVTESTWNGKAEDGQTSFSSTVTFESIKTLLKQALSKKENVGYYTKYFTVADNVVDGIFEMSPYTRYDEKHYLYAMALGPDGKVGQLTCLMAGRSVGEQILNNMGKDNAFENYYYDFNNAGGKIKDPEKESGGLEEDPLTGYWKQSIKGNHDKWLQITNVIPDEYDEFQATFSWDESLADEVQAVYFLAYAPYEASLDNALKAAISSVKSKFKDFDNKTDGSWMWSNWIGGNSNYDRYPEGHRTITPFNSYAFAEDMSRTIFIAVLVDKQGYLTLKTAAYVEKENKNVVYKDLTDEDMSK